MSSETSYSPEGLRKVAKEIRALVQGDAMRPFNNLKRVFPECGDFPLANWLDRRVLDRADGCALHAERFKAALTAMADRLSLIADEFERVDGENAAEVAKLLGEIKATAEDKYPTSLVRNPDDEKDDDKKDDEDDEKDDDDKKDDSDDDEDDDEDEESDGQ